MQQAKEFSTYSSTMDYGRACPDTISPPADPGVVPSLNSVQWGRLERVVALALMLSREDIHLPLSSQPHASRYAPYNDPTNWPSSEMLAMSEDSNFWSRPQQSHPLGFIAPEPITSPMAGEPLPMFNFTASPFAPPAPEASSSMPLLPQTPYDRGYPLEGALPTMEFHGFPLRDALNKTFDALADAQQPAWTEHVQAQVRIATKLAIVFCIPGHDSHPHQVNVLDSHGHPPTRAKVAYLVAREMARLLKTARDKHKKPVRSADGRELTIDDLALVSIAHISRGSLQPQIAVISDRRRLF